MSTSGQRPGITTVGSEPRDVYRAAAVASAPDTCFIAVTDAAAQRASPERHGGTCILHLLYGRRVRGNRAVGRGIQTPSWHSSNDSQQRSPQVRQQIVSISPGGNRDGSVGSQVSSG